MNVLRIVFVLLGFTFVVTGAWVFEKSASRKASAELSYTLEGGRLRPAQMVEVRSVIEGHRSMAAYYGRKAAQLQATEDAGLSEPYGDTAEDYRKRQSAELNTAILIESMLSAVPKHEDEQR
jgi:hypothetical protein